MRILGLDVETTKAPILHPWMKGALLVAVGLVDEAGRRKTWVFNHNDLETNINQRQLVVDIQAEIDKADMLVGHNLKFDLNWMRYAGINFNHCKLWCTMVVEYLLRGQRMGKLKLADLSRQYLNTDKIDRVATFWEAGWETTEIPLKVLLPYLEQDCINALAIYQRQAQQVKEKNMTALVAVQNELIRFLSAIECSGMKFDLNVAESHVKEISDSIVEKDTELQMEFGWDTNLDSNDELSVALYGGTLKRDGLEGVIRELKDRSKYYQRKCIVKTPIEGVGFTPPKNTELIKEGFYSTDKGTIKRLKAGNKRLKKIKELLIERSKEKRALETLVGKDRSDDKGLINKVQPDGCLHGSYNQTITVTGRLSSSNPNKQNLPSKGTSPIKQSIIPRYDWILNADASQVEWRAGAFLSQDRVMIQEILDGADIHTDNAINFFGANPKDPNFDEIRTIAKIMTFRLLYGGSAYGFYMDSKMPNYSKKRWEEIVEAFKDKYKGLIAWQNKNISSVYRNKGLLYSPTGRIFRITQDPKKGYNKSQICNYPVQALATADIMPLAMNIIYRELYIKRQVKSLMIGQVHDSIVFDAVEEELKKIAQLCVTVFRKLPKYIEQMWGFKFNVPLDSDCEYGQNYGEMQTLEL